MQKRVAILGILVGIFLLTSGCASKLSSTGWLTLIDGDNGLENWDRVGDANWHVKNGAIVADKGSGGFLVSRQSYSNFIIRAEFWAERDTNSGILIRLSDTTNIAPTNSYEINIWDIRPDPKYGTGSIVNFAAVPVPPVFLAGGRWNICEIEARGTIVKVNLNGVTTVTMNDASFTAGPIALQFGPGVNGAVGGPIRWRKVLVRVL